VRGGSNDKGDTARPPPSDLRRMECTRHSNEVGHECMKFGGVPEGSGWMTDRVSSENADRSQTQPTLRKCRSH